MNIIKEANMIQGWTIMMGGGREPWLERNIPQGPEEGTFQLWNEESRILNHGPGIGEEHSNMCSGTEAGKYFFFFGRFKKIKETAVIAALWTISWTAGSLLHCRWILYRLSHQRSHCGWWGELYWKDKIRRYMDFYRISNIMGRNLAFNESAMTNDWNVWSRKVKSYN